MFLRNVGCNSTDYTASHPRRWYSWQRIRFVFSRSPVRIMVETATNLRNGFCGLSIIVSSIPGASRFSEKQRVWNGVHSASWGQLRSYLKEK
jgi:hypothetical protein